MREKMKILSSPSFSLFCAVLNSAFAISSFASGSLGYAAIGTVFAGLCFYNYHNAR